MRCDKARKWLSDESDKALAGPKKVRLERHLEACRGCRAYRSDLARIAGGVRGFCEPELPPSYWDDFGRRLESRLEAAASRPAPARPAPSRAVPPFFRWKWAWAGFAMLVLAGTYLAVHRPHGIPEAAPVVFEDPVAGALLEAGANPAFESAVDQAVLTSIREAVGDAGDDLSISFGDNPLVWEGLSEAELRYIESELKSPQKPGGLS